MHKRKHITIIGLTGGIGSGKTTVSRLLKSSLKGTIINADQITHLVLDKLSVKRKLINHYSRKIVNASGKINRYCLANLAFNNRKNLVLLNRLTHPAIRSEIRIRINKIHKGVIILDAALLMETGSFRICDYLVFVDTPFKKRLYRITRERGWSAEELKRRESFQLSTARKKKYADFVIDNSKDLNFTRQQTRTISEIILERRQTG